MKTRLISKLNKELLLVELPENGYYGEYRDGIEVRDFLTDEVLTLANYTLLGSPDEISEEDVSGFLEQSIFTSLYGHYVSGIDVNTYCYKTALDSFNSALESEIYWEVNPLGDEPKKENYKYEIIADFGYYDLETDIDKYIEDNDKWSEAQEKTFDRNRTLIFVKN